MRNTVFYVPKKAIKEVAQYIGDNDLTNSINGLSEDGEIILDVDYEKEDSEAIEGLHTILESYQEEYQTEDEDYQD